MDLALLIILFIILELFVLLLKVRNSYTWMFVTMIILIEIELIFTLLLYVKLYDYSALYEWERPFHFFLSRIKVNYYAIFDVYTYALTGFMAMSLIVSLHEMEKGQIKRIATVISGIPIILFAAINSSYTNTGLHIKMLTKNPVISLNVAHLINSYNLIVLTSYIILPFLIFGLHIYKAKIIYLKKQLAIRSLYLLTIDSLGAFVFTQYVPYKTVLTYAPNYLRSPSEIQFIKVHTDLAWLAVLAFMLILLVVFASKSKMFDKIDLRKRYKRLSPKDTKISFYDTRTVFHTCKNILLSIDFTCTSIERKNPPQEVMKDIEAMRAQIKNGMGRLTHVLSLYNSNVEVIEDVSLTECIDNAIIESKIPQDIVITKAYGDNDIHISADSMIVEEALINLLKNAVDAIRQKGDNNGRIDIRIVTENMWSCVYIRDNGCGIRRKDYKRVFNPLFSTKKTAQNWGVGLSFVLSTVNTIGGQVLFRSKYGKFTEFEMLFPMTEG